MSKMADDAAIEVEEKRRELKECPFCEGEVYMRYKSWAVGEAYFVDCPGCGQGSAGYPEENRAIAAWNRRGGEGLRLKAGEEYTILCDTMWVDQYNALLADVERVIADAIKYEWREGIILDKLDTVLTRIHNKHKEHNESGT